MPVWNDVLIQNGEFRLVKTDDINNTIIQHHCDNILGTNNYYCDPDNNWYYCWYSEQTCAGCGAATPPEMTGFRALYEWER